MPPSNSLSKPHSKPDSVATTTRLAMLRQELEQALANDDLDLLLRLETELLALAWDLTGEPSILSSGVGIFGKDVVAAKS